MTSVQVGPFTTPLECERELPKAVQAAVSEYAEIAVGPEAASVRLSDDDLTQLVRDRWPEVRSMEIGGGSQDMFTLHAAVVFDAHMQQLIKAESQRLVIARRVQSGAVVFGGVLGLLALAWGGLKFATRR
jgi:predicted lipid carrier protein YhbT